MDESKDLIKWNLVNKKVSTIQNVKTIVFVSLLLTLVVPEMAFAANPWDNMLTNILAALNGPFVRSVAILVLIIMGFAAWFGKMSWMWFGRFVGGAVLIFSSTAIADWFIASV